MQKSWLANKKKEFNTESKSKNHLKRRQAELYVLDIKLCVLFHSRLEARNLQNWQIPKRTFFCSRAWCQQQSSPGRDSIQITLAHGHSLSCSRSSSQSGIKSLGQSYTPPSTRLRKPKTSRPLETFLTCVHGQKDFSSPLQNFVLMCGFPQYFFLSWWATGSF